MEIFLKILAIIGIVLLSIILLIAIGLCLPLFYDLDAGTNNKSSYASIKVKSILNVIVLEIYNDLIILKIFGIKITLKSHEDGEKKNKSKTKVVSPNDLVPEGSGLFRKLKLKMYIAERKVKEKVYKFRKTVNEINEYSYKLELLKKTIKFIEKILKELKPKDSEMCVEMGCGSADLTGKLTGALAIMQARYPNLVIKPNFEKACLNFELKANGHVMPVRLLYIGLKFYNEDAVKELRALKRKEK